MGVVDVKAYNRRQVDVVVSDLDMLEERMFKQQVRAGLSPENALKVIVNTVEGDESQLSPALREFAKTKGWL